MTEIRYKWDIIKIIEMYFPEAKIYVFGSVARGDERTTSDLDIAIDIGRRMKLEEYKKPWRLIQALPIPYKVDLVDFHAVPEEMQKNILRDGVLWKA